MLDLRAQIESERQRRDRALLRLEHSVEHATDSLANRVVEKTRGLIDGAGTGVLKGVIRSSPWAACFASLGAGALLGRLTFGGGGSCTQNSEPQRVIVEVQSNGNAASVAPAPAPKPMNPLDLIMQGLTVYGAVQRSMQDLSPGLFGGQPPESEAPAAQAEQNAPPINNV